MQPLIRSNPDIQPIPSLIMPAVLSLIVILTVLYFFWRFTHAASPYQIGRVLGLAAFLVFAGGLLFLTLTGRLPIALLLLIVVWPILAWAMDRHRANKKLPPEDRDDPPENS